MIGTLFLPICDKPYIFPQWEENLRNINLPRNRMKVVVSDSTGNGVVARKANKIIRSLGFAKHHIQSFKQDTRVPKIRQHWYHYSNMGERVGETFENGMYFTEGPLLFILEDDIILHPDTFNVLTDRLLANDSIGFVGACTFKKKPDNTTKVIGNIHKQIELYDDMPNMMECNWQPTGCCVTYGNLARQFNFKTSVVDDFASPDVTYCNYIRNNYGKSNYLCTDVRTKHMYKTTEGKQIVGEIKCPERPEIVLPVKPFTNEVKAKRTKNAPVFIVSYTGRGGSTLIQRILSSSPEMSIWGEDHGSLQAIFDFSMRMFEVNKDPVVHSAREHYMNYGYKGWIANTPPQKVKPLEFNRKQIENFFHTDDKPVWGIKVINWNSREVTRMHSLFPEATFIFLHRNLSDVEESYNKRKGWWKPGTFKQWTLNHKRLTEMCKAIPDNMHMINIDFDEVKKDLSGMCDMIEKELMIEEGSLDREFLSDHVGSFEDVYKNDNS